MLRKPLIWIFSIFLIAFTTSCGNAIDKLENKINQITEKAEKLDSLMNTELDKIIQLDSLINKETLQLERIDSLLQKSTNKFDSIANEKIRQLEKITN
jgi:myo-inositol catabolism protein IolC